MRKILAVIILLFAWPASAQVVLEGRFVQGGLVIGQTEADTKIAVDGQPVRVSPQGQFLIGFERNQAFHMSLKATYPDGTVEVYPLKVAQRSWKIDRINGLPESKVTPKSEDVDRIARERALIQAVRSKDTEITGFSSRFAWPVKGRISGVFGSQRILNGEPKNTHNGIDIAAPSGTPIRATAAGRVALAHQNTFYSGKFVIIDHGHGLTSSYSHMSKILVDEGDVVKKGDAIGRVGMTGRVTGPHLHWGVYLLGTPLDPALRTPSMDGGSRAER